VFPAHVRPLITIKIVEAISQEFPNEKPKGIYPNLIMVEPN